jgi:molecular chaperone DnaK (HSP70)
MAEINIVGIDLGTTNSAIAIWDLLVDGPVMLPNQEDQRITPSVVYVDPEDTLVGLPAVNRMLSHPDQVIYSVKRLIGRSYDEIVHHEQQHLSYPIHDSQQKKVLITVGERILTPVDISAEILRKLRHDGEIALGNRQIMQAVITVPAYFNALTKRNARLRKKRVSLQGSGCRESSMNRLPPRSPLSWVPLRRLWQCMTWVVEPSISQSYESRMGYFGLRPQVGIHIWVATILTR